MFTPDLTHRHNEIGIDATGSCCGISHQKNKNSVNAAKLIK
jgi:hypothetical protein